jgi:hypothetical protein
MDRVYGMGRAGGPFDREQGVKGKGSREWMIATTISVSNWHNREIKRILSSNVKVLNS